MSDFEHAQGSGHGAGTHSQAAQEHIRKAILDAMNYRYACKKFNPEKHIVKEDFDTLLEVARLSPSSFGLEPWKFLVIDAGDKGLRDKLAPISWGGKRSLEGADKVVVFQARLQGDLVASSNYFTHMARDVKGMPEQAVEGMRGAFGQWQENDFNLLESPRATFDWACKQTYIALGNMMTAAAMLGIDSCAIEGFNRDKVETLLVEEGLLDREHFGVSVMAGFGYRDEEQPKKARQAADDVIVWA